MKTVALEEGKKKKIIPQPLIDSFVEAHDTLNTKKAYKTHMNKFKEFLTDQKIIFDKKYVDKLIKNINDARKLPNPYDLIKSYYELFLQKEYDYLNPNVKDAHWYTVVALLYHNGVIINTHFLKKYMATILERGTSGDSSDSKTKEEIITFINNCNNSRLRLWVLFLASSGFRPIEPLTLRWSDIIEPSKEVPQPRVYLRDSKTDKRRIRFISQELFKQLQLYKKEKYALKRTTRLLPNGKRKREKSYNRLTFNPNQLIFSTENDSYIIKNGQGRKDKKTNDYNKKIRKLIGYKAHNLYRFLWREFDDVRKKLELIEKNEDNGRNKFTLNSFRHYVRTYVNRKVNRDFAEWYIGHYVSTYDDIRHNKGLSTLDDFKVVEKEFTFLDVNVMDEITKEERERLQDLELTVKQQNEQLKEYDKKIEQVMEMMMDNREKFKNRFFTQLKSIYESNPSELKQTLLNNKFSEEQVKEIMDFTKDIK